MNKENLRNRAISMCDEFTKSNGALPSYVRAEIAWKTNEDNCYEAILGLYPQKEMKKHELVVDGVQLGIDDIFSFYDSTEDFCYDIKMRSEDFVITDVYEFLK